MGTSPLYIRWKTGKDKCEVYIMSWNFNEDGIPKTINNNNTLSIIIQSLEDKMNREVKIHNSDISSKYLGSTSSIDGNSMHQFQLMKKDAQNGTNTLTNNPFNRPQATLYLNCYLNPKLHYPLSRSTLSNEQAKQIHKAHIPSALSAMGYNNTWSRELRFGTHNYCGL